MHLTGAVDRLSTAGDGTTMGAIKYLDTQTKSAGDSIAVAIDALPRED